MNLLPVAWRELRVAARQPRSYSLRTLTAGAALGIMAYAALVARAFGLSGQGRTLFLGLMSFTSWLCLLAGVRLTADAISRERREGTLGFLFLSHLSGWDVALGKLTAQATHAFYALLAAMPVLALPILQGGVTGGEFWWSLLALANTLFFAVCLGLSLSALHVQARAAQQTALLAVLFYWLGLPGLGGALTALGAPAELAERLIECSPLATQRFAAGAWDSARRALLFSHLQAWLFLGAAARLTRRAWRERPAGRRWARWEKWHRRLSQGSAEHRAAVRARLLEEGPFYWLIARYRWKPVFPALLVLGVLAIFFGAWWIERSSAPPGGLALVLGFTLHLLLKFWVAGEAATHLAEHREQGTLEVLWSTPLTWRDLMRAQFRAAWWQFGGPLLITTVLTLGFAPLTSQLTGKPLSGYTLAIAVLATVALWADVYVLVWLASWRALAARRARHAAGSAVFRVLVLPWLVLLVILPSFRGGGPEGILVMWAVVGFGSDALWLLWAKESLERNWRRAAGGSPGFHQPRQTGRTS